MRVVLFSVLLLVVGLAGCVSDDEPEPANSGGSTAAPVANNSPGAPTGATAATQAPVEQEVEVAVPYQLTMEGSGSTSTGAWLCDDTSGAGECNGHELEPHARFVNFEYPDTLTAASIEITWERLDSTYRLLVAEVIAFPSDGSEPQLLSLGYDATPLNIEIPEAFAAAGRLQLEVWPRSDAGIGPAFVFVDPQSQPFDVAVTMTLLPDV